MLDSKTDEGADEDFSSAPSYVNEMGEADDRAWGGDAPESASDRSLLDDLSHLYSDGKTYAEAELSYQKTRAAFVANRGKSAGIFGAAAALLALLALIALTVGLLMGLAPIITIWGATVVVVGLYLIIAAVCAKMASGKVGEATATFGDRSA